MGLNLGAVQQKSSLAMANSTPEPDNSVPFQAQLSSERHEYGTPSSQGQGESYRDSSSYGGVESKTHRMENHQIAPQLLTDADFDYKGTARKEYENEFYK